MPSSGPGVPAHAGVSPCGGAAAALEALRGLDLLDEPALARLKEAVQCVAATAEFFAAPLGAVDRPLQQLTTQQLGWLRCLESAALDPVLIDVVAGTQLVGESVRVQRALRAQVAQSLDRLWTLLLGGERWQQLLGQSERRAAEIKQLRRLVAPDKNLQAPQAAHQLSTMVGSLRDMLAAQPVFVAQLQRLLEAAARRSAQRQAA
ncbi:MAG: hypothetical protein EOO40_05975 [Deltaproteobacteria bacterium]|nr:MAG: hypothetical protein EOO40_05975 [Deltaproteobacteria bacterium]